MARSSCSNENWQILFSLFFFFQKKGIASFVTLAEAAGICIAVSEKILRRAEDADYDRIIERLSQKSSARGVVMFADEDETRWDKKKIPNPFNSQQRRSRNLKKSR